MNTTQLSEKPHVIFVDDDKNLQRAQKRMLRSVRDDWDLTFVGSASEALSRMAIHKTDVVVTDMRMPEMDGAELLEKVSRDHPEAIRIVLSGYGEKDSMVRTLATSHQFMDKPCEADLLISNIRRLIQVQNALSNGKLRDLPRTLTKLPGLPLIHHQFIQELEKSSATPETIAEIAETDISLTAKILKLTNSAYFSSASRVTNCLEAVQLLGTDFLRRLATDSTLFELPELDERAIEIIGQLTCRSLGIGKLAANIAAAEGLEHDAQNDALIAGTLAHIGSLLLCINNLTAFLEAQQLADREMLPMAEAEQRLFGTTHAELGAYFLELWGFAPQIVEAVAVHHAPYQASADQFDIVSAVHAAQGLSKISDISQDAPPTNSETLNIEHFQKIGKADRLPTWHTLKRSQQH